MVALKWRYYIHFSIPWKNVDVCEKNILCDYVYIVSLHVYIIKYTCIHTYLAYIHTYLAFILNQIYIFVVVISMLWHRQAIFESKGDKLSSSAEGKIRTQRVSDTYSPADWMPADKPTELSRIKLKTWTRQPVPMISKHSAHLTPLPFGIRTWLWRFTYLLLLMSMLWHRQAIFESIKYTCTHTQI